MTNTILNANTENETIANDIINIMNDWNCTELEARAAIEFDTENLDETRKAICTAVTHERLLVSLLPEAIEYMKNDRYKSESVTDEFIQSEAREMTAFNAELFAYEYEQHDDYSSMTEDEIRAAVFVTDDIEN